MKSNVISTPYFSAYPLKVITEHTATIPTTNHSPYLKAILSGKARTLSRVRIFPMINPYKKSSIPVTPEVDSIPNDIERTVKEWFNNYE